MPRSVRVAPRANESRASRVHRRRRRSRGAELVGRALALALLAWPSSARQLDAAADAWATVAPQPIAAVVGWVFTTIVLAGLVYVGGLAMLAAVRAAIGDRKEEASVAEQTEHAPRLSSFVAFLAVAMVVSLVVRVSVLAGGAWWLVSALVLSVGGALALQVYPAVVALTVGARPLTDRAGADRLTRLARMANTAVGAIYELPPGGPAATAFVAGFGERRSVFLASDVVRDWKPDEIDVVVAHELGHHRRGDVWGSLAADALALLSGLAVAGTAAGAGWVAPPASGASSLPALALIAWACWLASTPFRFALSRHQERQADTFALMLTGQVEAFISVIRRLGKIHLAEERPSALVRWMTCRHPTVSERLAAAEAFRRSRRQSSEIG